MQEQTRVELLRQTSTTDGPDTWLARIGGGVFPVVAYGLEPGEDGEVLVSLVVAADSIGIGDRPKDATPPLSRPAAEKARSTWGAPGVPDPREGLPGWPPEASLGVQVAGNASGRLA